MVACIDGYQAAAEAEHVMHIGDVGGIKIGEIQTRQAAAEGEHGTHIGDLGGIKIGNV